MDTTTKFDRILDDDGRYPPTHICAICDTKENPKSSVATTNFWLCPKCLDILKDIVLELKGRKNLTDNMKTYKHD